MDGSPEVDHVPLVAALLVEALEDVFFEVHAEGPAPRIAAVQRARAALLSAAAAQPARQTQLIEHARERRLPLEVGRIDVAALADRRRLGYVVGSGRGDRCPRRPRVRLGARGLVFP